MRFAEAASVLARERGAGVDTSRMPRRAGRCDRRRKGRLMRSHSIALAAVAMLLALVPTTAAAEQRVLYRTGFEAPAFRTAGLLVEQGWFAFTIGSAFTNESAATVSSESRRVGRGGVSIDGTKLEGSPGLFFGTYQRGIVYEPVARRTPIVRLSASIRLAGRAGPTCGMNIGMTGVVLSGPFSGNFFPNILIGVRERGGRFVSYLSNANDVFVNGPTYRLGSWIRARVDFDFKARTARGFINGRSIGRVPFTKRMSNNIAAVNISLGSQQPLPGVMGSVDDFSLVARVPS